MDPIIAVKAIILGIVEGLTEFLPISSTGHLILAGALLDWNDEKGKLFEIVIQLAAILAVLWDFRARLMKVAATVTSEPASQRFVVNVAIAFIPAAVLGVLFSKYIKQWLFAPVPVALAFIVGGLVILWVERRSREPRVATVDEVSYRDALWIGIAQCFALIPGTSRSGATIVGGLLRGLSRPAATEFSFFLAIPTMIAATGYELVKARDLLTSDDVLVLLVGCVASFASAAVAVRALLRYVSRHDFRVFAWYRIVFGVVVLATWKSGIVAW
jgi:undecaprenyl-diphosphatase